jgi:hypothetical protein
VPSSRGHVYRHWHVRREVWERRLELEHAHGLPDGRPAAVVWVHAP